MKADAAYADHADWRRRTLATEFLKLHEGDAHRCTVTWWRTPAGAFAHVGFVACECGESWTGPEVFLSDASLRIFERMAGSHIEEIEGCEGALARALATVCGAYRTAADGRIPPGRYVV